MLSLASFDEMILPGDKLYHVPAANMTKIGGPDFLSDMGLDVWGSSEREGILGWDVRASAMHQDTMIETLKNIGAFVVDEDLEASHGWEAVKERTCQKSTQECVDDFYTRYQNLPNMHSKIDSLVAAHSVISGLSIGSSYNNNDLKGMIVSNGGNGHQQVFYNCGIHAREWLPPMFCVYLAETLATGFENQDPQIMNVLDNFDIHIVPVLNPDGYQHSHSGSNMWRKSRKPNRDNSVGTDLNRNFCYRWGSGGSSSNPSSDTFMGYSCHDNPEVAAVTSYVQSIRPVAYMDIHAYGRMWLSPFGYHPSSVCRTNPRPCGPSSDSDYNAQMGSGRASADAIRATHGQNFSVGPITYIIYQASGSSVDHMYGQYNVRYSYSPEVRGTSFQPPVSNIGPSNEELYAAFLAQMNYILDHDA